MIIMTLSSQHGTLIMYGSARPDILKFGPKKLDISNKQGLTKTFPIFNTGLADSNCVNYLLCPAL